MSHLVRWRQCLQEAAARFTWRPYRQEAKAISGIPCELAFVLKARSQSQSQRAHRTNSVLSLAFVLRQGELKVRSSVEIVVLGLAAVECIVLSWVGLTNPICTTLGAHPPSPWCRALADPLP
eukprot:362182-Chlamydomonas_euryale.AAC.13